MHVTQKENRIVENLYDGQEDTLACNAPSHPAPNLFPARPATSLSEEFDAAVSLLSLRIPALPFPDSSSISFAGFFPPQLARFPLP
jgi:hypothetical protein